MKNLWRLWLTVAGLLTLAYYVVPNTPESKLVLYNGVGLLSVVLILVGIKVNKVEHRAPWLWIATGLGSFRMSTEMLITRAPASTAQWMPAATVEVLP